MTLLLDPFYILREDWPAIYFVSYAHEKGWPPLIKLFTCWVLISVIINCYEMYHLSILREHPFEGFRLLLALLKMALTTTHPLTHPYYHQTFFHKADKNRAQSLFIFNFGNLCKFNFFVYIRLSI